MAGQLSAATEDLDRSRHLVADLEAQLAEQERRLAELNAQLKGAASADELAKAQQHAAGLQAALTNREEELATIPARMAGMVGGVVLGGLVNYVLPGSREGSAFRWIATAAIGAVLTILWTRYLVLFFGVAP